MATCMYIKCKGCYNSCNFPQIPAELVGMYLVSNSKEARENGKKIADGIYIVGICPRNMTPFVAPFE